MIDCDTQVSQRILDLGALEKAHATVDPVRHATLDQALLEAITRKEIDPDDAFRYANDKKKFTRFVTNTGIVPQLEATGIGNMSQ